MTYTPDLKLDRLVAYCGDARLHAIEYIRYLGLTVKDAKQTEWIRGVPKFDDDTKVVKAFYLSTMETYKQLHGSFATVQDLRNSLLPATEKLLGDVTSKCLNDYAPVIWKGSGPRLTRITEHYPRYLEYNRIEDYYRIRTCVYHWIVHRTIRNFPYDTSKSLSKMSSQKIHPEVKFARVPTSSVYNASNAIETDATTPIEREQPNNQVADTIGQGESNEAGVTHQKEDEKWVRAFSSVQAMRKAAERVAALVNCSIEQGSSSSPVPDEDIWEIPRSEFPVFDREHACPSSNTNRWSFEETRSPRGIRLLKRKADMSFAQPNKRTKAPVNQTPRNAVPSERDTSSPGSGYLSLSESPPAEDVPRNCQSISNGKDHNEQMRTIEQSRGTGQGPEEEPVLSGEHDSVLGEKGNDGEVRLINSATTATDHASQEKRPSLIVILKVNLRRASDNCSEVIHLETSPTPRPPTPQTLSEQASREDCIQLTSTLEDLWDDLNKGHERVIVLKEALRLITRITADNAERLRIQYGLTFEKYDRAISQWRTFVEALIHFREATGFNGSKEHWAEFFSGLPDEKKKAARGAYIRLRSSLREYRHEEDFTVTKVSQNVAHMLFSVTLWDGMMDMPEMQRSCTKYNEKLLAWFG